MTHFIRAWRSLSPQAWYYLIHVGILTANLATSELFFNIAILEFGHSRAELGRLTVVGVWSSALLSLPLWWLVGRIGLRTALLIHGFVQAAALFGFACAPPMPVLLGIAAVSGAASVLFQVSAAPLMMRYAEGDARDTLFSANSALAIGVSGVASLVAGVLPLVFARLLAVAPESALTYQATFGIAAAGVIGSLLPLLLLPADAPRRAMLPVAKPAPDMPTAKPSETPIRLLLRRPLSVLGLLIMPALVSVGAALLLPYLNLFFKQEFGVSDSALGLIFALLNITTGAAVLAGPLLSARLGKMPTVVLVQALSIPFLLATGLIPVLGIAVGAALVRGALFNLARPLYEVFAMERTGPALRPTVIGLIGGASTVGFLFAPEISVRVQEQFGFAPLFIATAVCYTLATLVAWVLYVFRPSKQPQPNAD